jgi:hypothetical protein
MLYATGEIILVVIGILIALEINNWNQQQQLVKKEIDTLKAFVIQFKDDIKQFDESLAFYNKADESIAIILNHIENNYTYHDSLSAHFFTSTRVYGDSDLDNNVFETLKSNGVDLISNQDIRKRVVQLYEDNDEWIINFETVYRDFIFDASKSLFNTRFEDFWGGNYTDVAIRGTMVPLDFETLKTDQNYLYFIKTQRNHLGWLIKKPIKETKLRILTLVEDINSEIEYLQNK